MSKNNKFNEYILAPEETILELLEVNSMNQLDLASKIGITKEIVNKIINGSAPITTELALKIENEFNIPTSFWSNLESNYNSKQKIVKKMIC